MGGQPKAVVTTDPGWQPHFAVTMDRSVTRLAWFTMVNWFGVLLSGLAATNWPGQPPRCSSIKPPGLRKTLIRAQRPMAGAS